MQTVTLAQSRGDLEHLARHMTDLMHKVLRPGFGEKAADWTPAIDVCESDDHYEVIVELAGVRRDDIEVYTERGHLVVTGWRHDPTSPKKVCWHQMEIEEGQFRRRIALPPSVDETKIAARFRDGLLRIRIPKR
ncbi:MAG: Hsp20/alpha crystallin family protein [Planctomycetes bacterium]|nr:Hsp20/alpha crystallin family protein [Planctomycetota bacterium]